jgi:hypothetical protein
MMARPASHTCALAAHFFLAQGHAVEYNFVQQHPPRLSTMRTRGVTFSSSSITLKLTDTPAMPLNDAHFGGFFMPAVCVAKACR